MLERLCLCLVVEDLVEEVLVEVKEEVIEVKEGVVEVKEVVREGVVVVVKVVQEVEGGCEVGV